MNRAPVILFAACLSLAAADSAGVTVPLVVPAGAPLRIYLTRRISKKSGAPVEAKLMESIFAFDRVVIPAGSTLAGDVCRVQPVPRWERFRAILAGDFTPLHRAQVEFTSLTMPDGRKIELRTRPVEGMNTLYREPSKKAKAAKPGQPPKPDTGVLGLGKSTVRDQINTQLNMRTRGIADLVRAPSKKEWFYNMAMTKLPYHPQFVRRGTRFDAPLIAPLDLGSAQIPRQELSALGTQPPPDSAVRARLLTPLDSATAKQGDPVEAVVAMPLFSPDHKVLLPEGTRILGAVVLTHPARMFHRGGKLRFTFQKVELPKIEEAEPAPMPAQAIVGAAEPSGKAQIKVDGEGGVKATESKTRLLAPLISLAIANKSADTDAGKHAANGSAEGNVGGRTLGGGLGLGMIGSAVAQSSKYVGMAFGYYGLAWSVFNNVVARGGEVQFEKNAMLDIKFGARAK